MITIARAYRLKYMETKNRITTYLLLEKRAQQRCRVNDDSLFFWGRVFCVRVSHGWFVPSWSMR